MFVFIDTCVLLHYEFFDQVKWSEELGTPGVTLVFAPVTLSELEKKKYAHDTPRWTRAKAVVNRIASLELGPVPITLQSRVPAIALDEEPPAVLFREMRLAEQDADDRLLAAIAMYQGQHPDASVALLTEDVGLVVKARSRQIKVLTPPESLRLAEEPDEKDKELRALREQVVRLTSAAPRLSIAFQDKKDFYDYDVVNFANFSAGKRAKLVSKWKKDHPHITTSERSLMYSTITPGDAKEYNSKLEEASVTFGEYLDAWPSALNAMARTLRFELTLQNSGNAPAEEVEIQLRTDSGGQWRDEPRRVPVPPKLPTRPEERYLSSGISADVIARMSDPFRDLGRGLQPRENIEGPEISDGGRSVRYTIQRAKHHLSYALPAVYFELASDDSIQSFAVTAQMFANNVLQPTTAKLNAIVKRAAVNVPPPTPAEFDQLQESANADTDEED